jgi:hypothetical protein
VREGCERGARVRHTGGRQRRAVRGAHVRGTRVRHMCRALLSELGLCDLTVASHPLALRPSLRVCPRRVYPDSPSRSASFTACAPFVRVPCLSLLCVCPSPPLACVSSRRACPVSLVSLLQVLRLLRRPLSAVLLVVREPPQVRRRLLLPDDEGAVGVHRPQGRRAAAVRRLQAITRRVDSRDGIGS